MIPQIDTEYSYASYKITDIADSVSVISLSFIK